LQTEHAKNSNNLYSFPLHDTGEGEGYEKICHLIEITRLSLAEKPTLNDQFEIQKPIQFTLGSIEKETYPYFFGAVMFEVNIPSPGPDYSDLT